MDDLSQARRIRLTTAYFLPPVKLRRALIAAVRRGAVVELLLSGVSDVRVAQAAARGQYTRLLKAGVRIGFGTDAGVFPHGTQAKEFRIYVDGGMAPMEAIQCATRVAAECMGWERKVGAIEPGRYADLIAVTGDPLRNIGELENVRWVMKGGDVVKDELAR